MLLLSIVALLCALIPACLFCINLRLYQPPPPVGNLELPRISILIPARNEAHGIVAAIEAALLSLREHDEIIVMDDHSIDNTPALVFGVAARDPRVRLEFAPTLPPGWNGKQHACWSLAQAARHPILCFVDADVRLGPEATLRMAGFLTRTQCSLVSGFPRQVTETFLEWLLLPLIHFVLLGFLPLGRMRSSVDPALAAGCGQFMMVRRDDYLRCGGHSGIKLTMHDGLRLPRLFREHNLRTDLADLTPYATCRMYTTASEVWNGLAKNATEGLAAPARIVPVSLILFLGEVFPLLVLVTALLGFVLYLSEGPLGTDIHITDSQHFWIPLTCLIAALIFSYLPRILAARRFRQDWRSALLHPFGITLLLILQWYALIRQILRRPITWKTRAYTGTES